MKPDTTNVVTSRKLTPEDIARIFHDTSTLREYATLQARKVIERAVQDR